MGNRFGNPMLTEALFELQSTANALLMSEEVDSYVYNRVNIFYTEYVLPNWPEAWPPPPPPPPPELEKTLDKGDHDAPDGGHQPHGGGQKAADVAEAIGLFSALARADLDV
jgi:hypothetical protein